MTDTFDSLKAEQNTSWAMSSDSSLNGGGWTMAAAAAESGFIWAGDLDSISVIFLSVTNRSAHHLSNTPPLHPTDENKQCHIWVAASDICW